VPPVWAGDHNDYAFEACKTYPGRFKIMGRLDPWAPDSAERLENWLEQPDMLGIRMSSRWGTREEPFTQMLKEKSLHWFFEDCARLGIPLKLLTRDALAAVHDIATANPGLTMIIDHMSTMDAETVEGAFAHIETLLELSRYANVNVQISTAPNYSREPYPFEDVAPHSRCVRRRAHALGRRHYPAHEGQEHLRGVPASLAGRAAVPQRLRPRPDPRRHGGGGVEVAREPIANTPGEKQKGEAASWPRLSSMSAVVFTP